MKIRMIVGFLVSILFLLSAAGSAAESKSTIEIREGMAGMIGYGTLMSLSSLEQTLGHRYEGQVYQVHVRDYIRGWALRRPLNGPQANAADAKKFDACFLRNDERVPFEGMVNLNVYPEKNGRMNCILYLLPEADLLNVDKREWGYKRVDVTERIEEHEFSGGRVYLYEGLPEHADTAAADPGKYILIKEYVDQVTMACDAIGKDFRAEFDKSTRPVAYQVISFRAIIWKK
ncbi:MAG TPA: hypothetical protein VMZ49_07265 [Patescibacteria group bacterium]|nr:hypothetical protein [Patescibacteria group bacterium]